MEIVDHQFCVQYALAGQLHGRTNNNSFRQPRGNVGVDYDDALKYCLQMVGSAVNTEQSELTRQSVILAWRSRACLRAAARAQVQLAEIIGHQS